MSGLRALALAATLGLAAGCTGSGPADAPVGPSVVQGEVEFSADTRIMESFPVQLHTVVTMRNRARVPVTLRFGGGCPVLLRAYQTEARTTPVWDQATTMACTKEIQIVEIPAGDTIQRGVGTDARAILGSRLPDGRYFLDAYVQLVGAPLMVPAGAADLGIPR